MNDQQKNGQDDLTNRAQGAANTNENATSSDVDLTKSGLQTQDDHRITSSGIDDVQSNSNGAAVTDRADTAEQKTYGDIDLNKGLESQAKDEES